MANKQQHWSESKQDLINAAKEVGVDVGVMVKISGFESSFNSEARPVSSNHAKNTVRQFDGVMAMSSAYGYGQFLDSTWQQMLNKYGEKHGIEGASHFNREQANALRTDSKTQALMLAEFTKENIQKGQHLGGADADANVYAFHNLGAGDATKLLTALKHNPNQAVSSVLSDKVISVNHSLYGNGSISVAQSYNNMGHVMRQNEQFAVEAQAISQHQTLPVSPEASSIKKIGSLNDLSPTTQSLHADVSAKVQDLYAKHNQPIDQGTHNTAMQVTVALAKKGATGIERIAVKDGHIHAMQMRGEEAIIASVNTNDAANTPTDKSLSQLAAIDNTQSQMQANRTQNLNQSQSQGRSIV